MSHPEGLTLMHTPTDVVSPTPPHDCEETSRLMAAGYTPSTTG